MKTIRTLCLASMACMSSVSCDEAQLDQESNTFFIDGEFLYWKPNQDGMTYCITEDGLGNALLGSKNKEMRQHGKWGAGFRAGTGFKFTNPECDVSAYWTQFHRVMHNFARGPFIIGTQVSGLGNDFLFGGINIGTGVAKSKWNLKVDLFELGLGYYLRFQRFLLRPYMGIEYGKIRQTQTINYSQFIDLSNGEIVTVTIFHPNNFHGVGPKLGVNGDFALGAGLGVFGNFGATLLYGRQHNPVVFKVFDHPSGFPIPKTDVEYHQKKVIPAVQAQIGIDWCTHVFKHGSIFLGASYEIQYFWGTWRNQNSAIQNVYISDAGFGNLSLQGFTGQAKLSF